MRRTALPLITALLLAPTINFGAQEQNWSLAALLASSGERGVGGVVFAQGAGGILAALAGSDTLPVPCGTPIVQALDRAEPTLSPSLRLALAALLSRPMSEGERVAQSRDGRFAIHYQEAAFGLHPVDRDGNGLPDPIDRVMEAVVAGRSFLIRRLEEPVPGADASPSDLYLADLGHRIEGFTVVRGSRSGPAASFIVLDQTLSADRLMAATVHQLAHAMLGEAGRRSDPWWSEASAVYFAAEATGDVRSLMPSSSLPSNGVGRPLTSDDLVAMQAAALWPLFLASRSGDPGIVRQIWSEIAAKGVDPLRAADQVLRRSTGGTLTEAFREFTIWNLFTGGRDDGRHYPGAGRLPDPAIAMLSPAVPITVGPVEPIEPLASVAFHLPGDHLRGALDLEVTAEGGLPAVDLLISYRSETGGSVLTAIPLSDDGRGRASIPWSDAQEAIILLRNGALPGASTTRFEIRGVRNLYAPFDLASLTAEGVGRSMVLQWTTASETGLVGWNVYRGESPAGPFARVNGVQVPAFGDGEADIGYVFADDGILPGRRYYYFVEGTTRLGLAERSHLVSGRIEDSGR